MTPHSLARLIVYGEKRGSLLSFYRDQPGLPLALARHGRIAEHYEAMLEHSHVALFPGAPRIAPSFRVADLDAALAPCEIKGRKHRRLGRRPRSVRLIGGSAATPRATRALLR
jgi:hypothetical protein